MALVVLSVVGIAAACAALARFLDWTDGGGW